MCDNFKDKFATVVLHCEKCHSFKDGEDDWRLFQIPEIVNLNKQVVSGRKIKLVDVLCPVCIRLNDKGGYRM